jgi:hypothetical protein
MRVIFLDVDGCLNTPLTWGRRPEIHAIEGVLVKRVSDLADATNAVVVISSTWRVLHPLADLKTWLYHRGFRQVSKIIDITPDHPWPAVRQDEILAWIDTAPRTVTSFVVLDDDTVGDKDWSKVVNNMILINPQTGITDADCRAATEILTRKMPSPDETLRGRAPACPVA